MDERSVTWIGKNQQKKWAAIKIYPNVNLKRIPKNSLYFTSYKYEFRNYLIVTYNLNNIICGTVLSVTFFRMDYSRKKKLGNQNTFKIIIERDINQCWNLILNKIITQALKVSWISIDRKICLRI